MKKLLHTLICLTVGVLIGLYLNGNTDNNIPITQAKQTENTNNDFNVSQVEFYDNMIANVSMEMYDTSQMTEEILTNRNGKIIVEKIIGKVVNYKLDGEILNYKAGNGTYISYERVDGAKQGDTILTYYIYNPFTNEVDDVLTRLDFIIDSNTI